MARERKGHSDPSPRRRTLTRRGVLKAGSAFAAAGLGAGAARGAPAVSAVMAALSAYMSEAGERALPDDVDPAHVNASYKDGVLQISVARREAAQPKRITVQ